MTSFRRNLSQLRNEPSRTEISTWDLLDFFVANTKFYSVVSDCASGNICKENQYVLMSLVERLQKVDMEDFLDPFVETITSRFYVLVCHLVRSRTSQFKYQPSVW